MADLDDEKADVQVGPDTPPREGEAQPSDSQSGSPTAEGGESDAADDADQHGQ